MKLKKIKMKRFYNHVQITRFNIELKMLQIIQNIKRGTTPYNHLLDGRTC